MEDNNYYESAILTVKKENKLLKTELLQMYKSKKEEYFAEKKINKIKEPNLNPDQINPISQYSLSEDGILKA